MGTRRHQRHPLRNHVHRPGMQIPNVYCAFCGVILLPDPYWDDPAPPELRVRPWYAEVQGIYATDSTVESIALTGLGIVTRRNILCAPARKDLSYIDVGLETLEEWVIYNPSEGRWCFGFHGSCWGLFLQRLSRGLDRSFPDESSIVESVFLQFYCTPCLDFSSFKFGHDYNGAAQTHKPIGRPMEVDLSSHFYADPYEIPSTGDLEATVPDLHVGYNSAFPVHLTAPNLDDQHQAQKHVSASGWDIHPPLDRARGKAYQNLERQNSGLLEGLSPEMKLEILSYLSFGDLLSTRLVCRDLASLAGLDTLPQSYWRSRFFLHQEADFLFPSFSGATDWSRLFFATRACLDDGNLPLVNRKRIRQSLEPIATIIARHAVADEPYGPSLHISQSFWKLVGADAKQPSGPVRITGSFPGQLTSTPVDSPLSTGCRVLHHKALLFAAPCQRHPWRLGIHTVRMGAQTFISGLSISPLGVCKSARRFIGYHNRASEESIEIPFTSEINAIGVAFCAEGLTGIKFFFQNSDSSSWIGDSNGSEISQGTLNLLDGTPGPFLLAGLDHFKIVSLGLGQLIDHPEPSLDVFSGDAIDSPNVHTRLWTPHPPMYEDVRVSALLPSEPNTTFEPLSNIDFGGPRGIHLGFVIRVTFYMDTFPLPLIGMEIFYYDGKSMLFGSSGGCMISLFVNGPKGERVTELSVLEDNRDSPVMGLGGLKISTSYGRTSVIAPLVYRLKIAAKRVLLPSPNDAITGFTARREVKETQSRFLRVGILSQTYSEQLKRPDILDLDCHQVPDDQILYDQKFSHFIGASRRDNYQTYASLNNLRRIQASTGIQGRSRSPTCISGLKLEYHDHPSPASVGQWMNALDDSFELSLDEEIKVLTIWLTLTGSSTTSPGVEVGQVAAIYI